VANANIEAACVFHEITKHSYTTVRPVPHHLNWNNRADGLQDLSVGGCAGAAARSEISAKVNHQAG
jgi:hypothetical protein